MFKIFAPKLIETESIPGRKWVYKNFWGTRKTIERFDTTVASVNKATDVDFAEAMSRVKVYVKSDSTRGNEQFQQILKQKQPIHVTTYEILDDIKPYKTRIIGLIKSGDKKFSYFQSGNYGNDIPMITDITNGGFNFVM